MSYLAGIWRNEGTNIAKDIEGQGEVEKSRLIAKGGVEAAQIAAEFHGKGVEEAGKIEGEAITKSHTVVAGAEAEKVAEINPTSETLDLVTDSLQGFASLAGKFRSLANAAKSDQEGAILNRVATLSIAAGDSLRNQQSAIRGIGLFTNCDPGVDAAVKAFEKFSEARSHLDEGQRRGFQQSR